MQARSWSGKCENTGLVEEEDKPSRKRNNDERKGIYLERGREREIERERERERTRNKEKERERELENETAREGTREN